MSKLEFCIGVSGHQQLGDDTTLDFLSEQFRTLLMEYQEQARQEGKSVLLYSALAVGADQLFASEAMELGIPVEIVIPCARYEEIFSSPETLNQYHHLLSKC